MLKFIRVSSVFMFCLGVPLSFAAAKWDAQLAEFSRKLIALNGPATSSLEIKNASSLPVDDFVVLRRALQDQLKSSGLQIRDGAATSVRITVSENVRGLLWVGEVLQPGAETKVTMLSFPKSELGGSASSGLVLRRSLLHSQTEQILDAAVWQSRDQRFLLVLGPSRVEILRANGARWEPVTSVSIPHTVYPHDLRGRLWMGRDGNWNAFLPGIECSGAAQLQQPMTCHNSDDPWVLTEKYKAFYNSARNYFTGPMVPPLARSLPNFYSAAQAKNGSADFWVFSATDGQYFSFDGSTTRALGGSRDWGSDAVSVKSGCGNGTQLVVSSGGDDSQNDTVRAYEIGDRDARPVSPPVAFDGPVTAMWGSMEGDSAVAVIRTQAGGYEAYSVSVACNQ
jgi:hypothetical protein